MVKTVAITALSGAVSFSTALHFLRNGWNVRGSVRTQGHIKRLETHPLLGPFVQRKAVELVVIPDLAGGDFAELLRDVDALAHTASPFGAGKEKWLQWREQAFRSSLDVLEAAASVTSIKSVSFMSSLSAATPLNDVDTSRVYDERDWNTEDASKCQALDGKGMMAQIVWWWVCKREVEQAAWDLYKAKAPHWAFSVLLPGPIFGPPLHISVAKDLALVGFPEQFVVWMIQGKERKLPPTFAPNYSDVRVVAASFFEAINRGAGGRFLLPGGELTYNLMAKAMRDARPDLDQVIAFGNPDDLQSSMKPPIRIDTSKAETVLGVKHIPLKQMVDDILHHFEDIGAIPSASGSRSEAAGAGHNEL